jgi:hypothetical protein
MLCPVSPSHAHCTSIEPLDKNEFLCNFPVFSCPRKSKEADGDARDGRCPEREAARRSIAFHHVHPGGARSARRQKRWCTPLCPGKNHVSGWSPSSPAPRLPVAPPSSLYIQQVLYAVVKQAPSRSWRVEDIIQATLEAMYPLRFRDCEVINGCSNIQILLQILWCPKQLSCWSAKTSTEKTAR